MSRRLRHPLGLILLTRLFHHVSEVVYVSEQRDEVLRYSKNVEGMSSVDSPNADLGQFRPFFGNCRFLGQFKPLVRPQQLQMAELKTGINGGGASDVIFEFPIKKNTFENMYEAKNSEKNEIFSIFSNFGGQDWGLRGLRGHVPPKFKTKYMNSFLVVFVTLTYLVFEKFLREV